MHAQLLADLGQSAIVTATSSTPLEHEPDRTLLELIVELARLLPCHGSHDPSDARSLHGTQADSVPVVTQVLNRAVRAARTSNTFVDTSRAAA